HPGGPGMSDISSAGIARMTPGYRLTGGKDVLRGVDVPVVPGAAGRARPVPRRKGEFFEQVPARRAGLGRRVPAVDHYQGAPVPLALVLKLAAELSEPGVENGLAQPGFGRRVMPLTFRSSITIRSCSRTRRVLALCRKSCRASRTLRWARATLAFALARFAEPVCLRARRRW